MAHTKTTTVTKTAVKKAKAAASAATTRAKTRPSTGRPVGRPVGRPPAVPPAPAIVPHPPAVPAPEVPVVNQVVAQPAPMAEEPPPVARAAADEVAIPDVGPMQEFLAIFQRQMRDVAIQMEQINNRLDNVVPRNNPGGDDDGDDDDDDIFGDDDDDDDDGDRGGGGDGDGVGGAEPPPLRGIRAALNICGFEHNAIEALITFGIDNVETLYKLTKSKVESTLSSICKRKTRPALYPVFKVTAVENLGALCIWCAYHVVRGTDADLDLFDADTMVQFGDRYRAIEAEADKAKVDVKKKLTGNFESFSRDKFINWEELFKQYLQSHRSAYSKTTLDYLIRPRTDVTPDDRTKEFDCIDDDLVATHLMGGEEYAQDNAWLATEILGLVTRTNSASQYLTEHKGDGRKMFLSLKLTALGLNWEAS